MPTDYYSEYKLKWQRNYTMTIYPNASDMKQSIVISPPMSIYFNIIHATLASSNTGTFKIINLDEKIRKQIFHDRTDIGVYKKLIFQAGYGNKLSTIFQGNIFEAQSYRQRTEWVTEIEAFDGGYGMINGEIHDKIEEGALYSDVLNKLVKAMPNIDKNPKIGSFGKQILKETPLNGNCWSLVRNYAGDNAQICINNEQVIIMNDDEYVKNKGIEKLDSSTGLLDTPRRQDKFITVKMLFEPRMKIGQLIQVNSLEKENNETRKVLGITHNGVISEGVNGQCTTSAFLSLTLGRGAFVEI